MSQHRSSAENCGMMNRIIARLLGRPETTHTMARRSSRRLQQESPAEKESLSADVPKKEPEAEENLKEHIDEMEEEEEEESPRHEFMGVIYDTYQDMVDAKRKRNQQVLEDSGLIGLAQKPSKKAKSSASAKKFQKKASSAPAPPRRQSNRIRNTPIEEIYVESERSGKFIVAGSGSAAVVEGTQATAAPVPIEPKFFRRRVNDGGPFSVKESVANTKYCEDDSVEKAEKFLGAVVSDLPSKKTRSTASGSPTSVLQSPNQPRGLESLHVDDESEYSVMKVCPERIYSVAFHPSNSKTIVCAGDKVGNLGIWDADNHTMEDPTHLFRPHGGAIACLEWASPTQLVSTSYDGSLRCLDIEKGVFDEIFATYDDSDAFRGRLGYDMDSGRNFWTQFACIDQQTPFGLYISTSVGSVLHLDRRDPQRVTFHETLSEKKINTVSMHPNGYSMITAGLDTTVNLWDIRKFGKKKKKTIKSLYTYDCDRSVNSAFYSGSGQYVVATTMANRLEVWNDFGTKSDKPTRIRHDNHTGRWLTTFQAIFHPKYDNLFAVGSMQQPRRMEVFDATKGKVARVVPGLTSVASRLAFHPGDRFMLAGGNSSGRVCLARS